MTIGTRYLFTFPLFIAPLYRSPFRFTFVILFIALLFTVLYRALFVEFTDLRIFPLLTGFDLFPHVRFLKPLLLRAGRCCFWPFCLFCRYLYVVTRCSLLIVVYSLLLFRLYIHFCVPRICSDSARLLCT